MFSVINCLSLVIAKSIGSPIFYIPSFCAILKLSSSLELSFAVFLCILPGLFVLIFGMILLLSLNKEETKVIAVTPGSGAAWSVA
jgi:hypothetical protein